MERTEADLHVDPAHDVSLGAQEPPVATPSAPLFGLVGTIAEQA